MSNKFRCIKKTFYNNQISLWVQWCNLNIIRDTRNRWLSSGLPQKHLIHQEDGENKI